MGTIATQTMIHVVVDQYPLGIGQGFFDSVQLLGDIYARFAIFNHCNNRSQMPVGAFQPGYECGMACVNLWFCHINRDNPPGGI